MILYYALRWLVLVLLGLLIYAQTFQFNFVFDDYLFIVNNPYIKNFSNIHLIWHSFPMTRFIGMYSFALNYHFNQLAPMGYHVFNFIVHLLAVGLVWALADLLLRITKYLPSENQLAKELPFIMAALFLVHPVQTQAVTYITQRFESMATVFYLATIYCYLHARVTTIRLHRVFLFGFSGLFIILGIMTKEVVITAPVMILVAEWILFPKENWKKRIVVFIMTAGGLLCFIFSKMVHAGFNVFMQTVVSESHDGDIVTPVHYFLTQFRVFLTFLRLLILPLHQNLDYDYQASSGLFHPIWTFVGAGLIAGLAFIIFKLRRKSPLMAFGLSWLLITFSINLVPRSNVIFEHKLYLISFGFILSFVIVLTMLVRKQGTLLKILCCLIAVLSVIAYQRNKVWANEITLWEDCIKDSPNKSRVNANLGRAYGVAGRYDEAIYYLSRSIALHPDNITYENRGIIYGQEGKNPQALEDLNHSIAMDPNYFITYLKRSWIYQKEGYYKQALADLDEE